jgi:hypothetical protein
LCPGLSGLAVYPDDSVFLVSVVFVPEIFYDVVRFAPVSVTYSLEAHVFEVGAVVFNKNNYFLPLSIVIP